MWEILTDEGLMEAYEISVRLQLDDHFIGMLLEEIKRRNLLNQRDVEPDNQGTQGVE